MTASLSTDQLARLAGDPDAILHGAPLDDVPWPSEPPPDEAETEWSFGGPPTSTPSTPPAPPSTIASADDFPEPPEDVAYHGTLGMIARAVAPHTEADPVGILATLLVMFGSVVGGGPRFYQGSLQRTNVAALLVGESGKGGRKGTTQSVCREVIREAYPDLDELCIPAIASGEAISGHMKRHEPEERALIVEEEFGRFLVAMNREGSTLSAVLRQAWDGVPLGFTRSRDEERIDRHHISLLGHITPVELRARLTNIDAANGFGNRLLFVAVRRRGRVPFAGSVLPHAQPFVGSLREAIRTAPVADLRLDAAARIRWEAFYDRDDPTYGLAGALTARHEAQVARLALVYAVADGSAVIAREHLEAAIALADYARRSVAWAFGDSTGNRHADILRRKLMEVTEGPDGPWSMSWEDARSVTGVRIAADLQDAIDVLVSARLVTLDKVPRKGGGRARQVVRLVGETVQTAQTVGVPRA